IIEARQLEILEFVGRELERSRQAGMLAAGLIFTGGGALLRNVDRLGEETLGLPVRIGAPSDLVAPEEIMDPRYTTVVGLLRFAADPQGQLDSLAQAAPSSEGFFGRIARLFSFL
ncbi:MAG: hypothetical protein ABIL09_21155, partial [Gemmatimonadota bacterium]